MARIRVLDDQTINKIAAGEVIENPASVVKELVENSIDAGASEIFIEIRSGGRQMIRISDDGCGMSPDDALLCLERHATSKIRLVDDLMQIGTMGFRGEAIPSIASISKFMLLTCDGEGKPGTMVMVDGGKMVQSDRAARSQGTTIEVKNLFFNVPVRKKFQRSPTYDTNEILKEVTLQALAHPEIKFQMISDQATVLSAMQAESMEQRVKDVLGKEFQRGTASVELQVGDYKIQGVIGLPTFTRQNRTGQYLFINNRAVVSPTVAYAIRDGYGTSLPTNRHPTWVISLTMPGELVDVNVHPQKKEVRLRQQQELKEALVSAVKKGLQVTVEEFSPATDDYVMVPPKVNASFIFEDEIPFNLPLPKPQIPIQKQPEQQQIPMPKVELPRVLTTIARYVVVDSQKENGLCLVDQRAAHSRVIFEKLSQESGKIAVQNLLVPYTIELSNPDAALLRERLDTFNSMGISIHESGPSAFIVDALPQVFGNTDLQQLIQDMIHRIREFNDVEHFQKEVQKQMAVSASRAAVSSSKKLSFAEAQVLVDQLMKCESPHQCPFGKPTMAVIGPEELARKFNA